jgi:hypothetical protein
MYTLLVFTASGEFIKNVSENVGLRKLRREEIVLSQIRIGHSHLTHSYLLGGGDALVHPLKRPLDRRTRDGQLWRIRPYSQPILQRSVSEGHV